jgi:hypothetical protein
MPFTGTATAAPTTTDELRALRGQRRPPPSAATRAPRHLELLMAPMVVPHLI